MTATDHIPRGGSFAILSLDVHGGDLGLQVTVPAAVDALNEDPKLSIILVGNQPDVEAALAEENTAPGDRLGLHHAPGILPMDAKPTAVLRRGQNSSMWHALKLLESGDASACVSGGSTAALMTLGVKLVGLLPGILRPALMAHVPNAKGHTAMLDLGANLNVNARQLAQFAVMAYVTAQIADRIENPRVGLLNVGHEDSKGHEVVREAAELLKSLPMNYIGFIEGHDIFSGKVDIAVCDGFAGNLILKSSEGLVRLLVSELRHALGSSISGRMGGLLAAPSLRSLLARLDPSAHNGAPLLGLNGVVLKSHGGADRKAMTQAILEAGREARRRVPEKIEASIQAFQLETDR
ncbi:MAG TPA: phosphate acyltransferase PlsX [Xanthomonadales bacterium]|nr:phosphate acyltransferase PlsX [Xanthomonadales bacterium]